MYINYNNHAGVPKEVVSEFLAKASLDPKVHIIYHPVGIGNGTPIKEMTLVSKEDNVMLLEDDGFIFSSGAVDECFKNIENGHYDVVGSPRGSCGPEVWAMARLRYHLIYEGYGDKGPTWWPNFFFCKRADLLKTDMDFGSKEYKEGEYYKEIQHTIEKTEYSDTFAWASLQLRYLGVKALDTPQYKADPYEAESKEKKMMNWSGDPMGWIHGGSLSSGWGGYLSGQTPDLSHEGSKRELESRVAFWTIASDVIDGFDEFKKEYKAGIEGLIERGGLQRGLIDQKITIYKDLMNL